MRTTAPKPFCFVAMPFETAWRDTYDLGIKPACDSAGAYCERTDEQIFTEAIIERIQNQIAKADIVIAEMTEKNPNVFYEVGYAHALGKLTILLTKDSQSIPFDLRHLPHVVYDTITTLVGKLTPFVRHFVDNPPQSAGESRFPVDLLVNGKRLAASENELLIDHLHSPDFTITVHNISSETIAEGSIRLGLIARRETKLRLLTSMSVSEGIMDLDGNCRSMLSRVPELLPDTMMSIPVNFSWNTHSGITSERLKIRVFTRNGPCDFPILLIKNPAAKPAPPAVPRGLPANP